MKNASKTMVNGCKKEKTKPIVPLGYFQHSHDANEEKNTIFDQERDALFDQGSFLAEDVAYSNY